MKLHIIKIINFIIQ